jgi:Fe-S cluster assembly protein SufD
MTLTDTLKEQALAGATVLQERSAAPLAQKNDGLNVVRDAGRAALAEQTFPDKKVEQWKYTSLVSLQDGHLKALADATSSTLNAPDFGGVTLTIINGQLPAALPQIDGVTFEQAATDHSTHPESVFSHYNAATLRAALTVKVAKGAQVTEPLHLVIISESDQPASAAVRIHIDAADNSAFTVIEHYIGRGPALCSSTTSLYAGANSHVQHYRLQSEAAESLHIGELSIHQQRDSRVASYQLMQANTLRRNNVRVWMNESGADLVMRGVFIARNKTHVDNQICIEHAAPHCTSDQIFKGIAGESGKAVFNGRIHIHPGAKGSDAKLSNKNLLLSNGAEIDSKPELEIYNDDVKCAHGTTVGQMDSQQQFYLQSRGIDAQAAKRMLGVGFINELLLPLPNERVAEWARDWLSASL